ncbi:cyclase family protein [Paenibacillus sp. XY044]|uniref:cyclase family protein n=1 Tax=Paenibacillus sp. XY044 TaxID=2026089 RepID=UPI000B98A769|nr:cyclase family protein [Paenibacillus sp. XY044]OZB98445.1 cyclase [Paenibacillus sp. XY044]
MTIDLTRLIHDGLPVFPGDQETALVQTRHLKSDSYANHQLSINMHAGTHIDGPMHLTDSDRYLCEFPLDRFIGTGCILDVSQEASVEYKSMYEEKIGIGQIVVLHTDHGRLWGQPEYFTDYPVLTQAFAELLVRKQTKMVCLDMPSPDKYPFDIHKYLFGHGVFIAENLFNTDRLLSFTAFEIIALPLLIRADSSPARIIARSTE